MSTERNPLYALNDDLTALLARRGWTARSEADFDALDDLTHAAAKLAGIDAEPAPTPEQAAAAAIAANYDDPESADVLADLLDARALTAEDVRALLVTAARIARGEA